MHGCRRHRTVMHFWRFFRTSYQDFAMSFRSAKRFHNFKTIAYDADVHSVCVPNSLGDGTYSKGERLLLKFSSNRNLGI